MYLLQNFVNVNSITLFPLALPFLLRDYALRHTHVEGLYQESRTAVLLERGNSHLPSRQGTAARNPSAFDRMTINFSDFSRANRPPGQDARNQARKARVSVTPKIKMGVLFRRCPAGRQALLVAPFGMPLRDPDMSLDMRRLGVSVETPDSEETIAVVLASHLAETGLRCGQYSRVRSPYPG